MEVPRSETSSEGRQSARPKSGAIAATRGPLRLGRISEASTPEERSRLVQELFDRLEAIGTPEERAETGAYLMQALAETRQAEGRVF